MESLGLILVTLCERQENEGGDEIAMGDDPSGCRIVVLKTSRLKQGKADMKAMILSLNSFAEKSSQMRRE